MNHKLFGFLQIYKVNLKWIFLMELFNFVFIYSVRALNNVRSCFSVLQRRLKYQRRVADFAPSKSFSAEKKNYVLDYFVYYVCEIFRYNRPNTNLVLGWIHAK